MTYTKPLQRVPQDTVAEEVLAHYLASAECDANVRKYLGVALSSNTLRAYQGDLQHFLAWGGRIPATDVSIASYLAQHAEQHCVTTLSRRLVAIARAHRLAGLASPTQSPLVRATLQGVRRSQGTALRQVAPLQKPDLLLMVRGLKGLRGLRDKALLLVGFASAMRRSELVSLDVSDVVFTQDGLLLRLRRSKTDQEGRGREVAIPALRGRHDPGRVLQAWMAAAGIEHGPIFRRISRADQVLPYRLAPQAVALIVKQRAAAVGLDPSRLAGHSLRAGFVTNAARKGASSASIRRQTGHKSDGMLQRYIRDAGLFSDNPVSKVW